MATSRARTRMASRPSSASASSSACSALAFAAAPLYAAVLPDDRLWRHHPERAGRARQGRSTAPSRSASTPMSRPALPLEFTPEPGAARLRIGETGPGVLHGQEPVRQAGRRPSPPTMSPRTRPGTISRSCECFCFQRRALRRRARRSSCRWSTSSTRRSWTTATPEKSADDHASATPTSTQAPPTRSSRPPRTADDADSRRVVATRARRALGWRPAQAKPTSAATSTERDPWQPTATSITTTTWSTRARGRWSARIVGASSSPSARSC